MAEKVVYILGAGFSAPLGLPVMNNFLERSKDMFAENQKLYSYFQDVFSIIKEFSFIKNYYNTDLYNIEEILSILEMSNNLSNSDTETSFKKYIVDVVKYYTPDIKGTTRTPGDWLGNIFGGQNPLRDYGIFIACLLNLEFHVFGSGTKHDAIIREDIKKTYSIVTVNYDLVIENICELITNCTNTDSIKKKFLGFSDNESDKSILKYAKLHGSIDSENIIPPTWNKGIHKEDIKSIWKLAYKVISEANYIRIIGYSLPLTDSYVNFLLKSAVVNSGNLKNIDVICLDPDSTVYEKYKEFIDFKNFRFKSSNVIEYLTRVYTSNDKLNRHPNTDPLYQNIKIAPLNSLENEHETFMSK